MMQTRVGKHLNRSNAFMIVNNIYAKASIVKKGLCLLRHTFSYEINRQRNKSCSHTKKLKHVNLNTTTIYAKADYIYFLCQKSYKTYFFYFLLFIFSNKFSKISQP